MYVCKPINMCKCVQNPRKYKEDQKRVKRGVGGVCQKDMCCVKIERKQGG